jgi:peptide deformylase
MNFIFDENFLRQPSLPVKDRAEGGAIARKLQDCLQKHNRRVLRAWKKAYGKVDMEPMGVGLSAPQIGILKQVCIICLEDTTPVVLMNPRIIDRSSVTIRAPESCLSFPGRTEQVVRNLWVEIETLNLAKPITIGPKQPGSYSRSLHLQAVVAQHEIDHLGGILFFDEHGSEQAAGLTPSWWSEKDNVYEMVK